MNVVIVHGCSPRDKRIVSLQQWMFWVKKKLEARGIRTFLPDMPEPWRPKYEEWKRVLDRISVDEDTVLIGHSCGGGFVVRWLGETKKKIKKLILVAPAIIYGKGYLPFEDLLKFKINQNVKNLAREITIFVSDNESEGIKGAVKMFHDALGGKVLEMKGKGHFMFDDMKTEEFPELLREILN